MTAKLYECTDVIDGVVCKPVGVTFSLFQGCSETDQYPAGGAERDASVHNHQILQMCRKGCAKPFDVRELCKVVG